jgi:hypothetical protein
VAAGVLAAAGALAHAPVAEAGRTVTVTTPAEFEVAVRRLRAGGTIILARGRYPRLAIGPRGRSLLVVRARPGATVGRLVLRRTQSVRLVNVVIVPRGLSGLVSVERSARVEFRGLVVRGTATSRARVALAASTGVVFRSSRFTHCGDRAACLLLGRSSGVQILGSRFHDCFGCDFVRGTIGRGLVIRGNSFDRSLVSSCGVDPRVCNHNDLVQLQGGRDVLVERNRFGVYEPPGAAQLYLSGPLENLVVRDNVFLARDPLLPGLRRVPNGIVLGNAADRTGHEYNRLPRRVTIAHNTILSGAMRGWGKEPDWASSLVVSPRYESLPEEERPLVVNNVFGLMESARALCGYARLARNVTIAGDVCDAEEIAGDPRLDAVGAPTAESELVIDAALPGFSSFDKRGRPRDDAPDIGAYEYAGPSPR